MENLKKCKKFNKKQGVALAENILLISISLVIIISIFFPVFRNIINDSLASVANWFTNALASINING